MASLRTLKVHQKKNKKKKKDLLIEGTVENINNLLDFNNGRVEIS
jgi:hypothetical protein